MPELKPVEGEAAALSYDFNTENPNNYGDSCIIAQVVQDVRIAEKYIGGINLPQQWIENEQVFMAQVPRRNWEGTQVPRAHLGMPLVLEHVTAINAQIQDLIFSEDPPFSPHPKSKVSPDEQRATTEILEWELDKADIEEELESGSDECLRDGTAIFKAYWRMKDGYLCPFLEHVERQHILVAPNCRRPDIRKARWKAHIMSVTVEELDHLRGQPGYDIPSLEELQMLGIAPKEEQPQTTIQEMEGYFGLNAEISRAQGRTEQFSVDPRKHQLELIEYVDEGTKRIYTVLQRKLLIRDVSNKGHNKVEYLSAYFIRAKARFDGLGIAFLIGNEQRLEQGIVNALLDQLAISIFGMFKRKRGSFVFAQQSKVSPGKIIDVDSMDDFDVIKLPDPSPNAYQMLIDSESRAARRSGAQETAIQGSIPSAGSGGVMRTAKGAEMLERGASIRLRKFVKTLERQVLIPFLEFCVRTNPLYLDPKLVGEILDDASYEAYFQEGSAETVLAAGSKIKFKMLAATKMARRQAMVDSMPSILTLMQNEQINASLRGSMKVFEVDQVIRTIIKDVAGWPNEQSFVRDMTEEEQMQMMSENELLKQLAIMRAQKQIDVEGDIQKIDAENSGRAFRDVLKAIMEMMQQKGANQESLDLLKGMMAAQDSIAAKGMQPQPIKQPNAMGGSGGAGATKGNPVR